MTGTAHVGKRAAATAFDLALFYAPYLVAQSAIAPDPVRVVAGFGALVVLGAQAVLLTREGRTFGKRRWGLRVVRRATRENGGFWVNVFARAGAAWLPNLFLAAAGAFPVWLLVDGLVLLWRKDRLSLHDLIAGTAVEEDAAPGEISS